MVVLEHWRAEKSAIFNANCVLFSTGSNPAALMLPQKS